MIVTDHFVFVHLHKCGGSFVTEALLRFVPSAQRVGYHYPLSMLPDRYRGLPILGVVRNPWDFYVSYHAFQVGLCRAAKKRNARLTETQHKALVDSGNDPWNGIDVVFEELSSQGKSSFNQACLNYTQFTRNSELFDRIVTRLPTEINHRAQGEPVQRDEQFRGMNLRKSNLACALDSGQGLFTILFHHLFGKAKEVEFLRMESLREELLNCLHRLDVPLSGDLENYIKKAGPVNTSSHEPYHLYYNNNDLVDAVAEADAALIKKFDYNFNRP